MTELKKTKQQRPYAFETCKPTEIVGEKNSSRILELLTICDAYNKWLAEGGKSNAARLAARSKKQQGNPKNPD